MESIRKSLGLLIIALIGVPLLFTVIWSVGIVSAVSKPEYIPELPLNISEELPRAVDAILETAKHPDAIEDIETRIWLQAAARAKTSPSELLEEIGLLDWLRHDVSKALKDVYKVIEGKYQPHTIVLNLRPLKRAVEHNAIDRYFLEIMENMPPSTPSQQAQWEAICHSNKRYSKRRNATVPPSRPDRKTMALIAREIGNRRPDIPNEEVIFKGAEFKNLGLNIFSLVHMLSFLLFIGPGFFITLGAFIAEPMTFRTFRWSGVPVIITGLLALISAILPKLVLKFIASIVTWSISLQQTPVLWPPELIRKVTDEVSGLLLTVIDPLFYSVITTSIVVALCGMVICGLSFISEKSSPPVSRPVIPGS